jgi:putative YhdH/YhfP family quinone oxidoreductase
MTPFRAFRIHEIDGRIVARFDTLTLDDLGPGEVVVRVEYSDINYKDALAATGAGRILRKYPLVGGIDLAGVVVGSSDPRYTAGQHVLVTGCGLSETHDGGYAEYARLSGEWVIPLPPGMTTMDVMKLGTAGFTAALAIHRMEHNGQTPAKGPIVVTGATGGVGSLAINMLAGRGYEVVAVSGKPEADDYLRELGAARILRRQEIDLGSRPMERIQWAGAITHLERLEAEAIHIMREVVAECERPVMLYSIGKDSGGDAAPGAQGLPPAPPPFPLLHVDTTWKFREMYALRERMANESGMELLVYTEPGSEGARHQSVRPRLRRAHRRDEDRGLKQALDLRLRCGLRRRAPRRGEEPRQGAHLLVPLREAPLGSEEPAARAVALYNARKNKGESIRVFPMSNWTELDIWQYIHLENIPIVPLYFAASARSCGATAS